MPLHGGLGEPSAIASNHFNHLVSTKFRLSSLLRARARDPAMSVVLQGVVPGIPGIKTF
jgi:hypothetical protein